MLLIYELMCYIQFTGDPIEIRNGADVFIRHLFIGYGRYSETVYGLILLLILLIVMYFNMHVIKGEQLKLSFLFGMFVESCFWSLVLFIIIFYKILEHQCHNLI